MTEKLKEIDEQLAELIKLIDRERTKEALKKWQNFETFLSRRSPSMFRRRKVPLLAVAFLLLSLLIGYLRSSDESLYEIYFACLAMFRIALLRLLPLWDWTKIYTSQCLIGNPFLNNTMELAECNVIFPSARLLLLRIFPFEEMSEHQRSRSNVEHLVFQFHQTNLF